MITNERQYKITRSEVERFKSALREFNEIELVKHGIDPVIIAAQRNSLEQQLRDLEFQVTEYEKLRSGHVRRLFPSSIVEIGQALIEARISQGLSQRQLAERLSMKEQQIQRYEQDRYLTANLSRIAQVAEALELNLVAYFESRNKDVLDKIAPNLGSGFDVSKLPVKEMKSRGWLSQIRMPEHVTGPLSDVNLAAAFVSRAIGVHSLQKQRVRAGSIQDEYALLAWKSRILFKAKLICETKRLVKFSSQGLVEELVRLADGRDGPVQAVHLLEKHGVLLIFERHLPATHLDGAAILLDDQIPVIGLTLRHDRLDNFWFTLLHELGHVFCHQDKGLKEGFFDEEGASSSDKLEAEADDFAESAFLPNELWRRSFVRFTTAKDQIVKFSKERGIPSAIIAGRIRRERKDWTLFHELIGQNTVRKLMSAAGYWEN